MTVSDLERALYVERSLVKHLAMRRTLFVFPRENLGLAQAGASRRVADAERRRLARDVEAAGIHADGERWLSEVSSHVLAALSDGREATSSELREEIPLLEGSIAYGEGKSWGGRVPVGPRVLTTLSAAGPRFGQATDALEVVEAKRTELGAAKAGVSQHVEDREVALAPRRAAVGHREQGVVLLEGECARFSGRHPLGAHELDGGSRPSSAASRRRAESFAGDRRAGAACPLEPVAVAAKRVGGEMLGTRAGPEERRK